MTEGSLVSVARRVPAIASVAAIGLTALGEWLLRPPVPGLVTLGVTALAAVLLLRFQRQTHPFGQRTDLSLLFDSELERRQRALWFIQMRWLAIVVSLGLILTAVPLQSLLPRRAIVLLGGWWTVLVISNLLFGRWLELRANYERQIMVQGLVDLVVLTGFLNASGGIENPIYFAFIFHAIISGMLLPRRKAFVLTAAAAALFLVMAIGEYLRILPHFTNRLFPHTFEMAAGHTHGEESVTAAAAATAPLGDEEAGPPHDEEAGHAHDGVAATADAAEARPAGGGETAHSDGAAEGGHASHVPIFVAGRAVPFLVLLLLSAYLTSLVAQRLRRRESQLERAGRTLMLEHQRLERVVDSTGVGMMLVDPDLTVPWATDRAARWLRMRSEHSAGGRCPLYGAEDGCTVCIAEQTAATGVSHERERAVRSSTGGRRYLRHATSPVLDEQGGVLQVVELLEDVTDRKALESEAMHAGKLSALGLMAAGVAHEIGNPLSSLATRLTLLERRPEPEYVRESVGLLRGQIDRIRRIVHGISLFSRSETPEWTACDLNQIVRETLEIVRLDRRTLRIRLGSRLASGPLTIRGVKDQITQVVLNLVLNAVEASEEGQEVEVETSEEAGWAVLRVRDLGVGISAGDQRRLFEPFFSRKESGSGLGLAICYGLVNAHGGSIRVESEPGRGSTFSVALPSLAASDEGGEPARKP